MFTLFQGDSGGPFAINGTLIGVCSHGHKCRDKNNPSVYTEVSYYIGWIKDKKLVSVFKLCEENQAEHVR